MGRVNCAACGTANQEGARFCQECGKPLAAKCPRCSEPVPARAKFCMGCGQALASMPAAGVVGPPITPAPPPVDPLRRYIPPELPAKLEAARKGGGMQGERRVVTMLFCDVKGSTAAAGRL